MTFLLDRSLLFSTVACNATPARPSRVTYTLFPRNVSLGGLWLHHTKREEIKCYQFPVAELREGCGAFYLRNINFRKFWCSNLSNGDSFLEAESEHDCEK